MRFVAWNCNGGFRKKIDAVLNLNPDVAVVSEAKESCLAALDGNATSYVWAGKSGSKGIADHRLPRLETGEGRASTSPTTGSCPLVATKGNQKVPIVAVWVKRADDGYVKPTLRALRSLGEFIWCKSDLHFRRFQPKRSVR